MSLEVKCEFAGGLQILFENRNDVIVTLPEGAKIEDLVVQLAKHHLKRTPELFIIDNNKL